MNYALPRDNTKQKVVSMIEPLIFSKIVFLTIHTVAMSSYAALCCLATARIFVDKENVWVSMEALIAIVGTTVFGVWAATRLYTQQQNKTKHLEKKLRELEEQVLNNSKK